eukprot:11189922-Lingulodinium_polyedra.AAC.1
MCVRARVVDLTASLCTVSKIVHNDAVESTVRRHSGSQIAHACARRANACSRVVRERAICEALCRPTVDSTTSLCT